MFAKWILIFSSLLLSSLFAQNIQIPVHSSHQRSQEFIDVPDDARDNNHNNHNNHNNNNPRVFEIEPSRTPLRLVFSSESSPLFLDVQKPSGRDGRDGQNTQQHNQQTGGQQQQDNNNNNNNNNNRQHAQQNNNNPREFDPDSDYRIVDQFERLVPVRVRDRHNNNNNNNNHRERERVVYAVNRQQKNRQQTRPTTERPQQMTREPVIEDTIVTTNTPITTRANTDSEAKFGARLNNNNKEQ